MIGQRYSQIGKVRRALRVQPVEEDELTTTEAPVDYDLNITFIPGTGGGDTMVNVAINGAEAVSYISGATIPITEGDNVTIEAVTYGDWSFVSWSGHINAPENPTEFEMPSSNISITATFEQLI